MSSNVNAKVLSSTRILVLASSPWDSVVQAGNLANYLLSFLDGSVLPPSGVTVVGDRGVYVEFSSPLPQDHFFLQVNPLVLLAGAVPFDSYLFKLEYFPRPLDVSVPLGAFTGEVAGGILGFPAGQVFFSPSLENPIVGSELQLDRTETCVDLVDAYVFPSPPDPNVFFLTGSFTPGVMNNSLFVLAGAHPTTYTEFSWGFGQLLGETLGSILDTPASGLLVEPLDPTKISLLNVSYWTLEGSGVEPNPFICADVSAPIGPGATTGPFLLA